MNPYARKELFKMVKKSIYMNSDTISEDMCYYLCANKELFEVLSNLNHQIIIGRRGTGKTTLLKAFTYYINQEKMEKYSWYVKLDSCIPNDVEVYAELTKEKPENVVRYSIIIFLKKLGDFLLELHKYREPLLSKLDLSLAEDKILNFIKMVNEGTPVVDFKSSVQKKQKNDKTKKEMSAFFKLGTKEKIDLKGEGGIGFNREEDTLISTTTSYNYTMGLDEIKVLLDEVLKLLRIKMLYICIDEFCMIDRDISNTIQPKVAQCLKQLFFSSDLITVKIATVWNALRMQHRQTNGIREGLEIGNDIIKVSDLDLDKVYYFDQEKAFEFFKVTICNEYRLSKLGEAYSNKKRIESQTNDDIEKNYIISEMFSNNAFECLVCASQGNPRVFSILLFNVIGKAQKNNRQIKVLDVFEAVIDHYNNEIRQRIPYSLPICVAIDDYVTRTHNRIFLVKMDDYNNAVHYFDGLVANGAINQYPSAQLPRTLRNNYKLFMVHYGNYLDSFSDGLKQLSFESKVSDFLIFPRITDDENKKWRKFVIELPKNYNAEIYCTYCHNTFPNNRRETMKICPNCNRKIAYWY